MAVEERIENARKQATALYGKLQESAAQWRKLGVEPKGIMAASLEEITAHWVMCAEVGAEYHLQLDPNKYPLGTTREELVAKAKAINARSRRRKGYRTLVKKYGEESAKRIVSRSKNKGGEQIG